MDALTTKVNELNGGVNALLEQIRRLETRLAGIEKNGLALESRLGIMESNSAVLDQNLNRINGRLGSVEQAGIKPVGLTSNTRIPLSEQDLREIGRLPDCVKELQVFEGNPSQYISWIHNVEGILSDYEVVKEKPIYRAILQHIRQKIRGGADAALVAYNVFESDWTEIKRVLSLHYADKRDIRTLEHQLNQLTQRSSKLDEFYATVNHQLSLIVNKIKCDDYSQETVSVLVETYRNRALDVFIRGLNPELSRMLIVQRPKTLPEAYSASLDIQNLTLRNTIVHTNSLVRVIVPTNNLTQGSQRPPLPPRTRPYHTWVNRNSTSGYQRTSYNRPQASQTRNSSPPERPTAPKPAVKMEVDGSIQTRQVNYMNRPPATNAFKRGPASSMGAFPKQQKLFNIEADIPNGGNELLGDCEPEEADSQQVNFLTDALPAYFI